MKFANFLAFFFKIIPNFFRFFQLFLEKMIGFWKFFVKICVFFRKNVIFFWIFAVFGENLWKFSQTPIGKWYFGILNLAIWGPELRKKSCHMQCRSDHRPSSGLASTNWPAVSRECENFHNVKFSENFLWIFSQVKIFSFFWKKVCEFSHNYGKNKKFFKKIWIFSWLFGPRVV